MDVSNFHAAIKCLTFCQSFDSKFKEFVKGVVAHSMMVVKLVLRQAGIEKIQIPCVGLRDGLLLTVAGQQ